MQDLKIPKEVTLPVFVTIGAAGWNFNITSLSQMDPREYSSTPQDWVVLLATEVTFSIPQDIDVRGQLLGSLEKVKARILAENHASLKVVQDKIDNLLAIEHQGKSS